MEPHLGRGRLRRRAVQRRVARQRQGGVSRRAAATMEDHEAEGDKEELIALEDEVEDAEG